jgi:flagellar hook protein FlgE
MGLASALSTALTGLSAAETTIDVVGNNLANSNTVGFKASQANFATQFLQTLSLGSGPTDNSGGTNPRQTGLGTMVADITPNFSQGTIEISSNPTDLAIQGDGLFIVQGLTGDHLYTRNGVFKINASNEVTTITGNRVLGFGINDQFQIQRTTLQPVTIPLGSAAVAQATNNVYLEGQLSPTGDIAARAEQIRTEVLSNGYYTSPTANPDAAASASPNVGGAGTTGTALPGGGMTAGNTYEYRLVYGNRAYVPGPPATPPSFSESTPSETITVTLGAGDGSVQLDDIPADPTPPGAYGFVRIYRRDTTGPAAYNFIEELPVGTATYPDTMDNVTAEARPELNDTRISGKYRYYVTYATSAGGPGVGIESRPFLDTTDSTVNVVNGRVILDGLPTPTPGDGWVVRRVYRSLSTNDSEFHFLGEFIDLDPAFTLTDNLSDTVLATRPEIDLDGPKIEAGTLLVNVLRRDSAGFSNVFKTGTLEFTGQKGGRTLGTKELEIIDISTVQDLIDFTTDAMGIQPTTADPVVPIPESETAVPGVSVPPGGTVDTSGRIVLTGNNGVDNAIAVKMSGMNLIYTDAGGHAVSETVNLPWGSVQTAVGESAVTDTIVYDTLGIPLGLRLTMVLEGRTSAETTYRWFAESSDNAPTPQRPAGIAVGTGTISFDNAGNFKAATQSTVNIHRDGFPAVDPLSFNLNFAEISGLATEKSNLAVSRQDGSAPGVLTSFIVGEDGKITGVFSNGNSRDLGQIRLVRFANPNGLEQRGQNLFAAGVNSGLPVEGDPGSQGIGSIIAGAVELSNTDIGGNLIDLILASTMYRGNTRVITTVQQMLDELLALRR